MNDTQYILAIESSGSTCGAALSAGHKILAEYNLFGRNLHDKLLAELTRRILADNNVGVNELNAVAVSSGPGSFTGLRIGAAIAKALCFEDNLKLIAVPTLESIALAAHQIGGYPDNKRIISSVPSHKDLIYYQEYDVESGAFSEVKYDDKKILMSLGGNGTIFAGPGCKDMEGNSKISSVIELRAAYICSYAITCFEKKNFVNPDEFVPNYIQEFIPKVNKKNI